MGAYGFTPDHDGNPIEIDPDEVQDMIENDEYYCVDGCEVEPDGRCPQGCLSLVAAAGLI
jgi:hypothetical protein